MAVNKKSSQNTHHGSRETWPGEREPGSSDAEAAYQHINGTLVASFKNAMHMRTRIDGHVEYLQAGTLNPLLAAENKTVRFLSLWSKFFLTMCCHRFTGRTVLTPSKQMKVMIVHQLNLKNM